MTTETMTAETMTNNHKLAMKVAAGLWIVWGLVHMLAGIATVARDAPEAVQGIADGVDTSALDVSYPDAAGAIINQHGFNLFWIGAVTLVCAYFIWRRSLRAAFLAGLVGGLADVGYFVFLDLGGYVNFVPGTVMTIFSASAIVLTAWVWSANRYDMRGAPDALATASNR